MRFMRFRLRWVLGASLVAAWWQAPPAHAKLCVEWLAEPVYDAGTIEIEFRTVYPPGGTGAEPMDAESYPFRAVAVDPTGARRQLGVRSEGGPRWAVWGTFDVDGDWTLHLPQFEPPSTLSPGDPGCYTPARITVDREMERAAAASSESAGTASSGDARSGQVDLWPAGAVGAASIALAAGLVLLPRRRAPE